MFDGEFCEIYLPRRHSSSFFPPQATTLSFCGKSHSVQVGKVKSLGMGVWMDGNGDNREGGREGQTSLSCEQISEIFLRNLRCIPLIFL